MASQLLVLYICTITVFDFLEASSFLDREYIDMSRELSLLMLWGPSNLPSTLYTSIVNYSIMMVSFNISVSNATACFTNTNINNIRETSSNFRCGSRRSFCSSQLDTSPSNPLRTRSTVNRLCSRRQTSGCLCLAVTSSTFF